MFICFASNVISDAIGYIFIHTCAVKQGFYSSNSRILDRLSKSGQIMTLVRFALSEGLVLSLIFHSSSDDLAAKYTLEYVHCAVVAELATENKDLSPIHLYVTWKSGLCSR